jgi:hypothetical protein
MFPIVWSGVLLPVAIYHLPSNFIVVICPRFDLWGLLGSGSWVQLETPTPVAEDSGLDAKSPVLARDSGPSPRRLRLGQY